MFIYLNTGNGHIAQARVLKESMLEYAPEIKIELQNGFSKKQHICHKFLENTYGFACNYLHGSWPLIYGLGKYAPFRKLIRYSIQFQSLGRLKKLLKEKEITDVVSFHFLLSPSIIDAIKAVNKNIRLTVIVTDPFTGPKAWFYNNKLDYIVTSEEFKNFAIKECGVPKKNIHVMPFLLNKKYRKPTSEEEKLVLRKKYGFDEKKKLVLLAGGGEGLPGTLKIINQCIIHKADFSVAVVCGRNKALERSLTLIKKTNSRLDLHVFGFVDFMDSLIKMSDLVVSKAGASTVMEIVAAHKPVIINTYIHGQELGNMRFVVQNKAGFFIRHSSDIFRKINQIFSSEEAYNSCLANANSLSIDTDVSKIVKYLLSK